MTAPDAPPAPPRAPDGRRWARGALVAAALLSAAGVVMSGLARFGYSVVIGHLGGVDLVGVVNTTIALGTLTSLLWPASTGQAASKFLARARGADDPAQELAAAGHLARRALGAGVLLGAAAGGCSLLTSDGGAGRAVAVGLLVLALSGYLFVQGALFGTGAFRRAAVGETVAAVLALSLLVGVLLAGLDALLLAPLTLGYAVYAVLGWRAAGGLALLRAPRPSGGDRREMDAFVAWGTVGTLASSGLLQLSLVLAPHGDTTFRVGLYAAAVSLATPASMLARSLVQVLFPSMARAAGSGDAGAVRQQTDAVTRGLVVVMVPAFGAVLLAADPLLRLVYADDFLGATTLLQVVVVAVLLTTVGVAAVSSLTSGHARGIRASAAMSSVGFVVGLAVMAATAPSAGVTGIAIGYAVGCLVSAALPWVLVWRRQGQHWAGVSASVVGGVVVLAVGAAALHRVPVGDARTAASLGAAVVFAGGWALLHRRRIAALGALR